MTKSNVKAKPSIPALSSQASKKRKAAIIDLCTGSDNEDHPYKPPKDSTPSDSEEEELGEVAAGAASSSSKQPAHKKRKVRLF